MLALTLLTYNAESSAARELTSGSELKNVMESGIHLAVFTEEGRHGHAFGMTTGLHYNARPARGASVSGDEMLGHSGFKTFFGSSQNPSLTRITRIPLPADV